MPNAEMPISQKMEKSFNALLGAITADAATMPLHWVYGMDKVATALNAHPQADPAFFPVLSCPFYSPETHPGHYNMNQLSPYGEEILSLLTHMAKNNGDFTTSEAFALDSQVWAETHGGRLNHCIVDFMENRKKGLIPPGSVSDAQMNAVVKAVVITVRYAGTPELSRKVEDAIRVHQNNDVSVYCGLLAAKEVERAILEPNYAPETTSPEGSYAHKYRALTKEEFLIQLASDCKIDPPVYASSCAIPNAYTTSLYFASQAKSFEDTVRENIRFGGDNCSRSVFLGAVLGAQHGVPVEWSTRVHKSEEIKAMIHTLVQRRQAQLQ